jgi:hypothetical protein
MKYFMRGLPGKNGTRMNGPNDMRNMMRNIMSKGKGAMKKIFESIKSQNGSNPCLPWEAGAPLACHCVPPLFWPWHFTIDTIITNTSTIKIRSNQQQLAYGRWPRR